MPNNSFISAFFLLLAMRELSLSKDDINVSALRICGLLEIVEKRHYYTIVYVVGFRLDMKLTDCVIW